MKFVNTGDVFVGGARVHLRHQVLRQNLFELAPYRLVPRDADQLLELRVPGFDAAFQVHRQHAHVERFDDVFAEILQPLDLLRFLFERAVKLGVVNGDGNIAGDGEEQLYVVAGQKITIYGFPQTKHRHGTTAHAAGDVVIQVQLRDRAADRLRGVRRRARRFKEQIAPGECRVVRAEETGF